MYKETVEGNSVIRLSDHSFIPFAPGNWDYQDYLEWRGKGNRPEPALSEEEIAERAAKAARDAAIEAEKVVLMARLSRAPPQSLPGLAQRMDAIERLLGLRPVIEE